MSRPLIAATALTPTTGLSGNVHADATRTEGLNFDLTPYGASGTFSSDRMIAEYARDIRHVRTCPVV